MNEHIHGPDCGHDLSQNRMPSRKQMRQIMLPAVGDVVENGRVIYVNNGKFRFTVEITSGMLPVIGAQMESIGRIYEVERVDLEKKRYNAVFKGFSENPIDAPTEEDEDIVKVI